MSDDEKQVIDGNWRYGISKKFGLIARNYGIFRHHNPVKFIKWFSIQHKLSKKRIRSDQGLYSQSDPDTNPFEQKSRVAVPHSFHPDPDPAF